MTHDPEIVKLVALAIAAEGEVMAPMRYATAALDVLSRSGLLAGRDVRAALHLADRALAVTVMQTPEGRQVKQEAMGAIAALAIIEQPTSVPAPPVSAIEKAARAVAASPGMKMLREVVERRAYALPAVPEPVQVPDGWQLVPKVATAEMRWAGEVAWTGDPRLGVAPSQARGLADYYTAMLAAAPIPFTNCERSHHAK